MECYANVERAMKVVVCAVFVAGVVMLMRQVERMPAADAPGLMLTPAALHRAPTGHDILIALQSGPFGGNNGHPSYRNLVAYAREAGDRPFVKFWVSRQQAKQAMANGS